MNNILVIGGAFYSAPFFCVFETPACAGPIKKPPSYQGRLREKLFLRAHADKIVGAHGIGYFQRYFFYKGVLGPAALVRRF